MDYLRQLFEALGFSHVETFIASGNVIFDATKTNTKALERKIADYLQEQLGYPVAAFVRTISELTRIADYKPFSDSELNAEGHSLYIGFLANGPSDEAKEKLLSSDTELDAFHLNGRELYWLCRQKMSESKFSGPLLEKSLGMQTTLRSSNTVQRIAAKYR